MLTNHSIGSLCAELLWRTSRAIIVTHRVAYLSSSMLKCARTSRGHDALDVSSESGADDGLSLGKGGVEKFRVVTDAVDV